MKKVKILVIEDSLKHINDARNIIDGVIIETYKIVADFATTYVEAMELLRNNKYDGIISDVFFPFSKDIEWSKIIKDLCFMEIKKANPNYMEQSCKEYVTAVEKWLAGKEMHPTGILVGASAIKIELPIVFCSDGYHHGYKLQAVCKWQRKNRLPEIIDTEGLETIGSDMFSNTAIKKNWGKALEEILCAIFPELSQKRRLLQNLHINAGFVTDDIASKAAVDADLFDEFIDQVNQYHKLTGDCKKYDELVKKVQSLLKK